MVTTDMVLPENSARDFIRKVKSDPVTFDIPLLVISTLDERSGAYSLGASDYFIKPLDRETFPVSAGGFSADAGEADYAG